jgi:MFS family permease
MDELVHERPVVARLLGCALFVLVSLAFFLPFLSATIDSRVGEATGLELARGEPSFSGRYVHEAFEGQVEETFSDGQGPAVVALVAALAGAVLSWLPYRLGPALGVVSALVGLAGSFGLYQQAGSAFAQTSWKVGFWIAAALLLAAGAWALAVAAKTPWWWPPRREEGRRDYFARTDRLG